jgi:hypothetical protein
MRAMTTVGLIVAAFSAVLGHLVYHTVAGPAITPQYMVGGEMTVFKPADPTVKQLYLRRMLYLTQRPRHAWIQVLAQDQVIVYVNGQLVVRKMLEGFPVAVLEDIAPFLREQTNVIAICTHQSSIRVPPAIAVTGRYALSDGEHPLETGGDWRHATVFERKAHWWFEKDFDDRHWPNAPTDTRTISAKVDVPPTAITSPTVGQWITPPVHKEECVQVAREFELKARPIRAWLRQTVTCANRLAVNGIPVDEQEDTLGTSSAVPPMRRTFDITPLLHSGRNVVSLLLTRTEISTNILADLEMEDTEGNQLRFGSDASWRCRPGAGSSWLNAGPEELASWQPMQVVNGDADVFPWQPRREMVTVSLPLFTQMVHIGEEVGVMLLVAVAAFLLCRVADRWLIPSQGGRWGVASLALIPATLAIGTALLLTLDPRVARPSVYQARWVVLALASVPVQWLLLGMAVRLWPARQTTVPAERRAFRHSLAVAGVVLLLIVVGGWLRLRDLTLEPLQWDEVENYIAVEGFFEHGLGCHRPHPDLPVEYTHTSELMISSQALTALVSSDERFIIRFQGAFWSTLAIPLIFWIGCRMFGVPTGLIAAGLFTFSPIGIGMSNFGRYLGLIQFFTLSTIYGYWETIRGRGPINRTALWLTSFSFVALYLSWEAAALMAPPMIVALLLHRRKSLPPLLGDPSVWAALMAVGIVVLFQFSFYTLQQTQYLWFGTSLSDVSLKPMWRYPLYRPLYYLWQTTWNQDALLPLAAFALGCLLAVRSGIREPLRMLLVVDIGTAMFMSATLPALAFRYVHHLIPLTILVASVGIAALCRRMARLASGLPRSPVLSGYAAVVCILAAVSFITLASGITAEFPDLPQQRVEAMGVRGFKHPNLGDPTQYLGAHLQTGDVVMAGEPFQVRHLLPPEVRNKAEFYWMASSLQLPVTVSDKSDVTRDRRDGSVQLANLDTLRLLFSRNERIWYVLQPSRHKLYNVDEVTAFLLQHMDVVHEDYRCLILFRGKDHRDVEMRRQNAQTISAARASFFDW